MPGYRALPETLSGSIVERAREAGRQEELGDRESAARTYEAALIESSLRSPILPGFLCGRLAALYRRMKRYEDEVDLLERFRASQESEDARTRFDARLSKARALAQRHSKRESVALASIRDLRVRDANRPGRPSQRPEA